MLTIYHPTTNIAQINRQIGQDLTQVLASATKAGSTLFLFSGGSAFSVYEQIHWSQIEFTNLSITPLDERYDKEHSNYEELKGLPLYHDLKEKGADIWGIEDFTLSADSLAHSIDKKLHEAISQGTTIISVIGMGPDGHVSGIMPYPENKARFEELFMQDNKFVTYFDASGKNEFTQRITTTIPFLLHIDIAFGYIIGEAKREKLEEALDPHTKPYEVPASILRQMKDVRIYTDLTV